MDTLHCLVKLVGDADVIIYRDSYAGLHVELFTDNKDKAERLIYRLRSYRGNSRLYLTRIIVTNFDVRASEQSEYFEGVEKALVNKQGLKKLKQSIKDKYQTAYGNSRPTAFTYYKSENTVY